MYHTAYRPRRRSSVFVPLLMLVTIGLAIVLLYQIWSYFREQYIRRTENKAAVTVVSGRSEMLIWGQKQWVQAATGSVLREGDSIHVFPNSRVSLALLNGGFVRLNGDTEITITELRTRDREDMVSLSLTRGEAWLKKSKSDAVKTSFSISTTDLTVRTIGTIFAVEKRDDTRAYVTEGKIAVDVKNDENGKVRVIDTMEVGVGQQAIISDAAMEAFRKRENPDIIFALSDLFRQSEWYEWNTREDIAASAVSVKEAVSDESVPEVPLVSQKTETVTAPTESQSLASPKIVSPDLEHQTTKESKVVVIGTTSERTQKIIVSTFIAGKKDSYTLQKYVPGSIEWSYIASTDFGNYVPGSNIYKIIAVDKEGRQSEPLKITLFYEKEKEPADMSAPSLVTINSQAVSNNTYETCEEPALVEGKIGKGIVKVLVNDFQLTRYVPDSKKWYYKAQSSFGNLKEGLNEYEVFGLDSDGRKTPSLKFSIQKCAPPKTEPSAESTEPAPAPS